MKNKIKRKIHKDKKGLEFIKDTYFISGKMKFRRIYVIDGMPADEFYEKNSTDFDLYMNGDYELMSIEKDSNNHFDEQNNIELDSTDVEQLKDLPV